VIRSAFESVSSSQIVRPTLEPSDCDAKFGRASYGCSAYILHMACALSSPFNGPVLPLPLLEIILWTYSEQASQQEPVGNRTPLHLALERWKRSQEFIERQREVDNLPNTDTVSDKAREEWKTWIRMLIRKWPNACSCPCNRGRLPIHNMLDCIMKASSPLVSSKDDVAMNEIVQDLVHEFPQSLEVIDPISRLFPYQQAATNPLVSLNTVYFLIRRSPSRIS
jgi:hypothetical protein